VPAHRSTIPVTILLPLFDWSDGQQLAMHGGGRQTMNAKLIGSAMVCHGERHLAVIAIGVAYSRTPSAAAGTQHARSCQIGMACCRNEMFV